MTSKQSEIDKIKMIYKLLFNLATGKNISKIEINNNSDEYDVIYQTIYECGIKLKENILKSGMITPFFAYEGIVTYVFVLNEQFQIIDSNSSVLQHLQLKSENIHLKMFDELLDESSKSTWFNFIQDYQTTKAELKTVELQFLSSDASKIPMYCVVFNSVFQSIIFVLSVQFNLKEPYYFEDINAKHLNKNEKDAMMIEKIRDYILQHLDEPLQSIQQLSNLFNTEPHNLRNKFKKYNHTSIYQFYQEERLKKAYQLIQYSKLSLKEIAYQCGFDSYLNFYKAFKKKYSLSPSQLKRYS